MTYIYMPKTAGQNNKIWMVTPYKIKINDDGMTYPRGFFGMA